jgi:hypothetical protein
MGGVNRKRRLRPSEKRYCKVSPIRPFCPSFYKALSLLPIAWVIDVLRLNVKLSGQCLHERFYPFYLEVCWADGFVICYNADANSLTATIPSLLWYDRPLSLPFLSWLYLAILGTEAITNNKVIVDILRTG